MGAGQILQVNPPTAVIAFNDRLALGIMESFRAAGIYIPAAISVLGYDDSHLARLSYVQLSSISQDAPLLAAAVDRAVNRIEGAQVTGQRGPNTSSGHPQNHSPSAPHKQQPLTVPAGSRLV